MVRVGIRFCVGAKENYASYGNDKRMWLLVKYAGFFVQVF